MRTLLLLLMPAAALANAPAQPTAPTPLKNDWEVLLAGDCDLEKAHVRTTIEASALRNTPYALKGYAFKTPELTKLFQADGGWYTPDPAVKEPTFTLPEQACIKKLKDHEAALDAKVEIPKAFKTAFLGDHQNVIDLRAHTARFGAGPVKLTRYGKSFELQCEPCPNEAIVQLSCEGDTCHLLVPGG